MKKLNTMPLILAVLLSATSASAIAENSSVETLQKQVNELTAELNKYKAEEARVKHNLSLMTKADVSMNARDWDGFNEVHSHDVVVTSPDAPIPSENKEVHLTAVQSF